jgi:hypothetical protein
MSGFGRHGKEQIKLKKYDQCQTERRPFLSLRKSQSSAADEKRPPAVELRRLHARRLPAGASRGCQVMLVTRLKIEPHAEFRRSTQGLDLTFGRRDKLIALGNVLSPWSMK